MHARTHPDAAATPHALPSDLDQLLPGEDPESAMASDITHWVAVHSELLATNRRILGATLARLRTARSADARLELLADRRRMQAEMDRFERHLRFWCGRERRRQLRSR